MSEIKYHSLTHECTDDECHVPGFVKTLRERDRVMVCQTGDGCTCGAPVTTPAGMHHCDCPIHPGWCGQQGCLPCERNGKTSTPAVRTDSGATTQPEGER